MMEKNMGKMDRLIRAVIGIFALILAFIFGAQSWNWLPILLLIVAVLMLGTASIGVCLLYIPLKINTNNKK